MERLTQELRSTRLERQDLSEQLLAANAALAEAQASVQEQAGQLDAASAAAEQAEARCGQLEEQVQGMERRCAELTAELAEKANEVSGVHLFVGPWVEAVWLQLCPLKCACSVVQALQDYAVIQRAGCRAWCQLCQALPVFELGCGAACIFAETTAALDATTCLCCLCRAPSCWH